MKQTKFRNVFLLILIFISSITIGQNSNQSSKKILGPYVQDVSYKQATICWATLEGTTSITKPDGSVEVNNQYSHHKTIWTNLKANTKYTYDILNDGTDLGKGTFKTYPKKIEDFKFVVYGDTRTRHDIHQKIVNRVIKEDPLFVINSGDLVANGNVMSDWDHFFRINDKLMRNVPYYTVLGNHEKNSENYYDFFSMPGENPYYSFTVGDALFIVLDFDGPYYSTPAYLSDENEDYFWSNISKQYFDKQKEWLENILTVNKEAGFIFVAFHPTWYSVKKSRLKEAELNRKLWGDVFERHHVNVVLNGHDHYYHHAAHGGVDYIVSAGGGAPLYDNSAIQPETVLTKKIEHYLTIEVKKDEAVIKAIDINGKLFETIVTKRRN